MPNDVGPNPGASKQGGGAKEEPPDFLTQHSRIVAALLGVTAVVLMLVSASKGVRHDLPGPAFDWSLGLVVLRASVTFAILAALVVVLVRGWGGIWPQRISTTGADYDKQQLEQGSEDVGAGASAILAALRDEMGKQGGQTR